MTLKQKRELEHALALQPDLPEAYYQLAMIYTRRGESQKAAEALSVFHRYRAAEANERSEILRQAQQAVQPSP
jgi:cytochrome c-type biogenesis protein CcmH/NrfG